MDPKYTCEADVDAAFRDAREGALMALEALSSTARESKKEMNTIVEELQTVSLSRSSLSPLEERETGGDDDNAD